MSRHIAEVEIINFQSHKHTKVKLHPGVNAFTGPTDNGKSAVLRAIRWALWNIGIDDGDFVRTGETRASVAITFSDGVSITRTRDKKRNSYTLVRPGQPKEEYFDFGRKVPNEILAASGMYPVRLDPDKSATLLLNMATQLEGPFFLGETAGARSRILGRLAGVNVIDVAAGDANTDLMALRKDLTKAERDLADTEAQLLPYADLDEQDRQVTQAEILLKKAKPVGEEIDWLEVTTKTLWELDGKITAADVRISRTKHAPEAIRLLNSAESVRGEYSNLDRMRGRYCKAEYDVTRTDAVLQRYAKLPEAAGYLKMASTLNSELAVLLRINTKRTKADADAAKADLILLRHAGLPEAVKALNTAQGLKAELVDLLRIDTKRRKVMAEWAPIKARLSKHQGAPGAAEAIKKAEAIAPELARLLKLQVRLNKTNIDLRRAKAAEETSAKRAAAVKVLQEAAVIQEELERLAKLSTRYQQADVKVQTQQRRVDQAAEDVKDCAEEYARALQEAGMCPTCLQPVSDHAAAEIAHTLIPEEVLAHV